MAKIILFLFSFLMLTAVYANDEKEPISIKELVTKYDMCSGGKDREMIRDFLLKKGSLPDGRTHKKRFKGTKEELDELLDELCELRKSTKKK